MLYCRNQNGYENYLFSEEEEEEEEEGELEAERQFHVHGHQSCTENDHDLVADIILGGESLMFLPNSNLQSQHQTSSSEDQFISARESLIIEDQEDESLHGSPQVTESEYYDHDAEEIPVKETVLVHNSLQNDQVWSTAPITIDLRKSDMRSNAKNGDEHIKHLRLLH